LLTLDNLYKTVDNEIYTQNKDNINAFQNTIKKTLSGDITSKQTLVSSIRKIIEDAVPKNEYINLIKQYHIDYFNPIYTGNIQAISEIINKNILTENASEEELLEKLSQIVFQELYGLSVIDEYSYGDIKGINEISCNAYNYISMQILGKKIVIPNLSFKDNDTYKKIVKKSISFDAKQDLKPDYPEILCQRINGARVTALMPPYSKEYSLNIRYFDVELISSKQFIKLKTSTPEIETFIENIMPGRPNIAVIGDQGTGKTTYILRLIGSIPDHISIATIEPMFELNPDYYFPNKDIKKLQFLPDLKTAEDAFQTCLRLGRDLIINGEVRSPDEAVVALKAWTRQNRGSICSFHTTSVKDYMYDFKNLLMQKGYYYSEYSALYDVARATDIVIHLDIDRKSGNRYIKEIAEIILDEQSTTVPFKINTLFKYNKENKRAEVVGKLSSELVDRCLGYEFDGKNLEVIKSLGLY
jgi:pilus assembly protein CpaF